MLKEFRSIGVFAAFSRWSLDISSGDGSDTEVKPRFHLQTVDSQQLAENETGETTYLTILQFHNFTGMVSLSADSGG